MCSEFYNCIDCVYGCHDHDDVYFCDYYNLHFLVCSVDCFNFVDFESLC